MTNISPELRERIGTLIGEATMCWKPIPEGTFQSDRASEILDEILAICAEREALVRKEERQEIYDTVGSMGYLDHIGTIAFRQEVLALLTPDNKQKV